MPTRSPKRYVIGSLHGADPAKFEEHLLVCPRCLAAAESADEYVRAMKIAARRLRSENRGGEGS